MRLWTQPLPTVLKAKIVLFLSSLVEHSSVSLDPTGEGGRAGGGLFASATVAVGVSTKTHTHSTFVASVIDSFVTARLIQPVLLVDVLEKGMAGTVSVLYEEEDTCVSYEEEDTCAGKGHVRYCICIICIYIQIYISNII
jgi:hypothetical protein